MPKPERADTIHIMRDMSIATTDFISRLAEPLDMDLIDCGKVHLMCVMQILMHLRDSPDVTFNAEAGNDRKVIGDEISQIFVDTFLGTLAMNGFDVTHVLKKDVDRQAFAIEKTSVEELKKC